MTQTQTDLRTYATHLLQTNLFLTAKQVEEWTMNLLVMNTEQIKKLVEGLEKSRDGLSEIVAENLKNDPEKKLIKEFKKIEKEGMKEVADIVSKEESAQAGMDLEKDLKTLTK